MGSFIAWRGHALMPTTVKAVFAKKGFDEVHELQIGEYHLAYAEKQLMKSPCVHQEVSFSLLLMGTAIIPQLPAEDSLKTLVAQYKTEGKIETSSLLGNYLIVLFHTDGVQFYTDEANGYSLYFHRHGIWSDSQLAMVHALHSFGEPTSWAHDALNINLSIGFLYGEKTIFKDVYRFDTALHA
ncbi:MAG: hypothetical protein ACKO6L_02315, partial [Flavobacteriales bacterium]